MLIRIRGNKVTLPTAALWTVGTAFALLWAVPVLWMLSTSFKQPGRIMSLEVEWLPWPVTLENYQRIFQEPVARWFLNSTVVTSVATAGNVIFGALTGYALARMHFPGRNLIFGLMLAVLMIPGEMSIVPLFLGALKLQLSDTYAGLILPLMASVFSAYLFRQYFLSFPRELEDAVFIDGGTRWTAFRLVAFPLARPATIAACILMFTSNWNAFLWPLLIIFKREMKTLPIGLAYFNPAVGQATAERFNFGTAMAATTVLAVPTLVVFLFLQRYFIEGVSTVGIKG
jgi:multiple sugar transport system permease protein